jgi:hypothetical protein
MSHTPADIWIESAECAVRVTWNDFVKDNEPDVVEETRAALDAGNYFEINWFVIREVR